MKEKQKHAGLNTKEVNCFHYNLYISGQQDSVGASFFAQDGSYIGTKTSLTIPTFVQQDRSRARVT